MNATVSVNGTITDAATAVIPVLDHGFLYGEGVYETLRTYGGRPFLFDRHVGRLRRSAARIALTVPYTDEALADEVAASTAAHARSGEYYIRVLLTRGVGPLGYDPANCPTPSLVVIVKTFVEPPARAFSDGIPIALVSVRRNHPDALDPVIKSNNLLNNVLAMQEALSRGGEEALMQNRDGELTECAQSNFFVVRDGRVLTPPLDAGLLPGITRAFVLDLAQTAGVDASECRLTPGDLSAATEAFITSTTREIMPVVRIDERPVGTGRPGPVTLSLLKRYRAAAAGQRPR
jgi:branched-chain amino acid aminotransferase